MAWIWLTKALGLVLDTPKGALGIIRGVLSEFNSHPLSDRSDPLYYGLGKGRSAFMSGGFAYLERGLDSTLRQGNEQGLRNGGLCCNFVASCKTNTSFPSRRLCIIFDHFKPRLGLSHTRFRFYNVRCTYQVYRNMNSAQIRLAPTHVLSTIFILTIKLLRKGFPSVCQRQAQCDWVLEIARGGRLGQ
jgi:hypothetical protein